MSSGRTRYLAPDGVADDALQPLHIEGAPQAEASDPAAEDPTGQLWFGAQGQTGATSTGYSDDHVGHIDSDGGGRLSALINTEGSQPGFQAVGLDTSAGLYFALVGDHTLRSGHITTTNQLGESSQIQSTQTQFGVGVNADEVNAIAVDPVHHVVYVALFGQTDDTTAILKVDYNPATGAFTYPYNAATGAITDSSKVLMSNTSTGGKLVDVTAMHYDVASHLLYYVDDDLGYSFNGGANHTWGQTKGIYVVDVTAANPQPTLLTSAAQFVASDANTYIAGMTVDAAKSLIYFTVNNISAHSTTFYYMPIAGGTATAMALPGGVNFDFTAYYGNGSNAMALDDNAQVIYVSDNGHNDGRGGRVLKLTLSADGHSFSSGATLMTLDSNNTDSSNIGALVFDSLPTLNSASHALSATTTEAVQGGSAITLLTGAAITITDPDNVHLGFATVKINNAQAGDLLAATTTGTSISASYNSTTHVLTLTGDDTYAHYIQVLNSVTFQDTGSDSSSGSHPTRSITWTVSDGVTIANPTAADPNVAATTAVIDRAPTLVADNFAVLAGATVTGTSGTAGTGVLGNDSDLDADAVVVTAVNGAGGNVGGSVAGTYGHLTLNANGSYSYVADNASAISGAANGSHPVDTFTYTVSDGLGGVTSSTVSFTIDRAPTVVADTPAGKALEGGAALTGNVLTNDSDKDGDTLSVSAVAGSGANVGASLAGTYGHIAIGANGAFSYLADNTVAIDAAATGSHLTDTFTYTAFDSHGGSTSSTITVSIDRAPTASADAPSSQAVQSGAAVTGNLLTNDADRDGDTLSVSAVAGSGANVGVSTATTYGHVTAGANGAYSYLADKTSAIDAAATGSHLTDTIAYTTSDGFGGTAVANLVVTLDRGPTIVGANVNLAAGASSSAAAGAGVLANDSDRDGDTLTVSAVGGSGANVGASVATTYGHITLNADGGYSYIADNAAAIAAASAGSHPVDTIAFTVDDGHGGTAAETLTFTIDRAAQAAADALSTAENATAVNGSGGNANLLANDQDKDGDAIAVTAVNGSGANVGVQITLASGALLTVNANGGYSYDPNHAFDDLPGPASGASNLTAADTFTYTVTGGATVTATVTVDGVDSDDVLNGTAGADVLHGGIGADVIHALGGVDQLFGDGGDDYLDLAGNLTAADKVDGGLGTDRLFLRGDYSAGVSFNATTVRDIEVLNLAAGFSYALTTDDATVASGASLKLQAAALGAGEDVAFDGSAETDGAFVFNTGAGDDVLTGGALADEFHSGGGDDVIDGGGGDDRIGMADRLTAADRIDGGTGRDLLSLSGDYSSGVVFTATTLVNVETIWLADGFSYALTSADATVAAGQTLTVRAAALTGSASLAFDGSAETDGAFRLIGGEGEDHLKGGAGADWLVGGAGDDVLTGGGGKDILEGGLGGDTFVFTALADSLAGAADTIRDFSSGDLIDLHLIDADAATGGDQAFHFGATPGHVGDLVVGAYDAPHDRTRIALYVNSDNTPDAIVWVQGDHHALSAADFVL